MNPSLELLDIDELRPHERTRPDLLNALIAEIKRDGKLKLPILVERSHHVILDGPHRHEALRALARQLGKTGVKLILGLLLA